MEINLENREKIIVLLEQGICPICGKGPFKVPLIHINKMHSLPKNTVKDLLMLTHVKGFAEEALSKKRKELAKKYRESGKWTYKHKINPRSIAAKEKQGYLTKKMFDEKPETLKKFQEGAEIARAKQARPVLRISPNGEEREYKGVNEAAREMQIDASSICKAIRGKRGRSLVAGYKWKYKD